MALETARYLIVFLVFYAAIGGLGYGLLRAFRAPAGRPAATLFAALGLGLTLAIVAYSLARTHGRSVNLGLVVLAASALAWRSRKGSSGRRAPRGGASFPRGVFLEVALVGVVIFVIQAYSIYPTSGRFFAFPSDPDRAILTDFANFMNTTGRETVQPDYVFQAGLGNSPYHYFELWLTALLSFVSGKLSLITDHLVSAPLVGAVVYAGMRAVAEGLRVPLLAQLLLCFTLTVANAEVQIPVLGRVEWLGRASEYYNLSAIEYPKHFAIYLFELGAVLVMMARKSVLAATVYCAMAVANFLSAPAVIPSAVLAAAIGWRRRNLTRTQFAGICAVAVGTALFILVFYAALRDPTPFNPPTRLRTLLAAFAAPAELRTARNILVVSLLQIAYVAFPYLVLAIVFRKELARFVRRERVVAEALAVMTLGCAAGLATWALIHFQLESHQLFVRFAHVSVNVAVLIVICALFQERRRAMWVVLAMLVALKAVTYAEKVEAKRQQSLSRYSPAFVAQVAEASRGINPIGVFFKDASEYVSARDKCPTVRPGDFLGLVDSRFYPLSLSVFEAKMSDDPLRGISDEAHRATSSFFKFVEAQKQAGTYAGVEQSQVDFLDRYHIQYAVISAAAELPAAVARRARATIRDADSGERFVLLR